MESAQRITWHKVREQRLATLWWEVKRCINRNFLAIVNGYNLIKKTIHHKLPVQQAASLPEAASMSSSPDRLTSVCSVSFGGDPCQNLCPRACSRSGTYASRPVKSWYPGRQLREQRSSSSLPTQGPPTAACFTDSKPWKSPRGGGGDLEQTAGQSAG